MREFIHGERAAYELRVPSTNRVVFLEWLVRILRALPGAVQIVAHREWLACRAAAWLTLHPLMLVSHGVSPYVNRRQRLIYRSLYATARAVAVSPDVGAALQRDYAFRDIIVINNGVEAGPFRKPPALGRLELAYVGRLESRQKRPEILLHLTKLLHSSGTAVRTVFAGDGPMRDSLLATAASLGISRNVRFVGWSSAPTTLMENAHIVLLPTRWEGNSLVILEALSCGRPVIASEVAGTRFLKEQVGVYLVPTALDSSPEEEAIKFHEVLARTHLSQVEYGDYCTFCKDIYERSLCLFSVEKMLEQWQSLLASATCEPYHTAPGTP